MFSSDRLMVTLCLGFVVPLTGDYTIDVNAKVSRWKQGNVGTKSLINK